MYKGKLGRSILVQVIKLHKYDSALPAQIIVTVFEIMAANKTIVLITGGRFI